MECCWKECSFKPNSVDGRSILRFLSGGARPSGLEIDVGTVVMSGPFDDLYHLNRRAGAASMGSGLVSLTTRAVSSGTSCSVADVARLDILGDPLGCDRPLLNIVGPRPRARVSCMISACRESCAFSSASSSFFAAKAVDSSKNCSRLSRSSAISRCKASRCAMRGSSSARYCSLIVSRRFVSDRLRVEAASPFVSSKLHDQLNLPEPYLFRVALNSSTSARVMSLCARSFEISLSSPR